MIILDLSETASRTRTRPQTHQSVTKRRCHRTRIPLVYSRVLLALAPGRIAPLNRVPSLTSTEKGR